MDEAPRAWVGRLPLMVLAVLAAGFLALGVAEARADAPTFDEPVRKTRGSSPVSGSVRPGSGSAARVVSRVVLRGLLVVVVRARRPLDPARQGISGRARAGYPARTAAALVATARLR